MIGKRQSGLPEIAMRMLLPFLLVALLALTGPLSGCGARENTRVERGPNATWEYVEQAREYREEGRFELARQSYVLALSICRNDADLAIIKRELAGVELMIRTMR